MDTWLIFAPPNSPHNHSTDRMRSLTSASLKVSESEVCISYYGSLSRRSGGCHCITSRMGQRNQQKRIAIPGSPVDWDAVIVVVAARPKSATRGVNVVNMERHNIVLIPGNPWREYLYLRSLLFLRYRFEWARQSLFSSPNPLLVTTER